MISLKHKLILTHPTKCAGTSIRTVLREKNLLDLDEGHIRLYQCRDWLAENHPELPFEEFRVVSLTRNPWDRVVSLYHHYKGASVTEWYRQEHHCADRPEKIIFFCAMTFSEFVKSKYLDMSHVNQWWGIEGEGRFANELIRYEHLKKDIKKFFKSLKITDYAFPHIRHNSNRPIIKNDYRTYYNDELAEIVARKFGYEIKQVGHTFDGGIVRK